MAEEIRKSRQDPGSPSPLRCQLRPSDLVPDVESLITLFFVHMRSQAMTTRAEMVSNGAMG